MRNIIILFGLFTLTGCFLGYERPDSVDFFSTVFYKEVYLVKEVPYKITPDFWVGITTRFEETFDNRIDFYQDPESNCYLFSTSNKELFDMEKSFFHVKQKQLTIPIFLIEKDNLSIVSKEEYERIKSTLKPHPFDPSLCKPKPVDLK